ncbi:hypothetical protein CKM354_000711800 [Cercospora kikuchii]|uniref:Uncharacterized protein n=1 Tax=Cercospora kikuchii TaxID=84275 RepID=A0A9P3FDZ8_9PEZI|nr:uncharacterized protein CKM354_000711800 [Cercospora kikuchii]GIZ43906.1 hypothetical protein CKM354_000711800 [Cercospora kikuchii]
MPMTKAFLDDFPREIRDEIYNVPIKKGQSPDALYHDTCIVMAFAIMSWAQQLSGSTTENFADEAVYGSAHKR